MEAGISLPFPLPCRQEIITLAGDAMKLVKITVYLLFLLTSCVVGYFMFSLSGRDLPTDFIRPVIASLCAFIGVLYLIKLHKNKIAFCCHFFIGFGINVITTLAFLYYRSIGAVFTGDDVVAIDQSNLEEILDFFEYYIFNTTSLISVLVLLGVYIVLFYLMKKVWGHEELNKQGLQGQQQEHKHAKLRKAWRYGVASFMILACVIITTQLRPLKYYRLMVANLENQLASFHEIAKTLETSANHQAHKQEQGELYVLVIGESLSRDSMGLYNHSVDNNPFLESLAQQQGTFVYPNAYASFVHTVPSITASFSQGNFKTGLTFPHGDNLISMLKKAGFTCYWLSNQVQNGAADTPVGAISSLANHVFFTTHYVFDGSYSQQPDMILLPTIEKTLNELDPQKNNFIVIHVMGNHSPYYNRFPKDYPTVAFNQDSFVGVLSNKKTTNTKLLSATHYENYLTSIKYNDMVLSKIYALVAQRPDYRAMVYYSDHGEALLYQAANDITPAESKAPVGRHNVAQFSYAMTRIPLIINLSQRYQELYPEVASALQDNLNRIFTNDTLYDFILDLSRVKSDAINYELSIANPAYDRGEPNTIEVVDHKIVGHDPDYLAFSYAHSDYAPRLAIKSANSVVKANSSLAKGYTNLQLNTWWHQKQLYVRVLSKFDSNFLTLPDFLKELKGEHSALAQLLLNIDNEDAISKDDYQALASCLSQLKEAEQSRITLLTAKPDLLQLLSEQIAANKLKIKLLPWVDSANLQAIQEQSDTSVIQGFACNSDDLATLLSQLQDSAPISDEAKSIADNAQPTILVMASELVVQTDDLATELKKLDPQGKVSTYIVNYYNAFDSDF